MCVELKEDEKQIKDIKTRTELKAYLHSIIRKIKEEDKAKEDKEKEENIKEVELAKISRIDRDFLQRVLGDRDPEPKVWVKAINAYALCKFIAFHEKKKVKEVLEILIKNGLLPDDIRPDRKIFEEDAQQEEHEKNAADIENIEEDGQQEESEKNDVDIENIEELTACVKGIIESMHFRIKEKEWKFKNNLIFQTIEVEKDSVLLAGTETWRSVGVAYLCTDSSDKDFEQIYEILRTYGKDKKIVFLILCKDCYVYEKVNENLKVLISENSILLINLEKPDEVYILSMNKRHREVFEYEKEFASYIEEGKRKGCTFWSKEL